MDKKQREARRQQEDMALNRGLIWVGAAIVLEVLLMLLKRFYLEYRIDTAALALAEGLGTVLRVLRIAGGLGAVACVAWCVWSAKGKRSITLPVVLAAACGAVAVCAHVTMTFQQNGVQMLYLLVAAWAGLALVYYLYQKEFFFAAAACGSAVLGLWFVRYTGGLSGEVLCCAAVIAVVLAAALWLKKGEGRGFLPKETSYGVMLVTAAVSLVVVLGAALLGAAIAYYLLFLMAAWLFVLLVYYTVKLI